MGYSYKNRSLNNKSFKNRGMIKGGRNVQFAEMQEVSIDPSEEVNDNVEPMEDGKKQMGGAEPNNFVTYNGNAGIILGDDKRIEMNRIGNLQNFLKNYNNTFVFNGNAGAIIGLNAGETYFFYIKTAVSTAAAAAAKTSSSILDPKYTTDGEEIIMVQIPKL